MIRRLMASLLRVAAIPILLLCVLSDPASASPGFGVSKFSVQTTVAKEVIVEHGGVKFPEFVNEPYSFDQAGGHPFALTTTIEFNGEQENSSVGLYPAGGDPKDVVVDLPPGLLADPLAVPRCPLALFTRAGNHCSPSAQVGTVEISFADTVLIEPVYDLIPEPGQSAEFGVPSGGRFNIV